MAKWRTFRVLLILLGLSSSAFAQSYHWRRAIAPSVPWHSIAFNPLSHGRVIFAGSGQDEGVFRSDDSGSTFVKTVNSTEYPLTDIHQIFCPPSDTNVVLAVTPTHLYRSTDGGWHLSDTSLLGGVDGEAICYNSSEGTTARLLREVSQRARPLQRGAAMTAIARMKLSSQFK